MSTPNTTSPSMTNEAIPHVVIGGGAASDSTTGSGHRPETSHNSGETIVSLHAATVPSAPNNAADTAGFLAHDDADVQEYMNRLLKRSSSSTASPTISTEPAPAPAQSAAPVEAPEEKPWEPTEFVPRSVAPEKKSNLDALREVANQSQRSAIETSSRQRLQAKSLRLLALTFAALAFGTLFMYMSRKMFDTSMITGIGCFVVSIPTLGQLIRSLRPDATRRTRTK